MPAMSEEETKFFIKFLEKNSVSINLIITKEDEKKAEQESEAYFNKIIKNVCDLSPYSVYIIISKLGSEEQIQFIKDNIEYIKEHDEEIFLYDKLSPHSLSYFLSFNVIKKIKELNINIFNKIISRNDECLFHGFDHADYINYYKEFSNDLNNKKFIGAIYHHNRLCYEGANINNLVNIVELQEKYNVEFSKFILNEYKDRISTFNPKELLRLIMRIDDLSELETFIDTYYTKIKIGLSDSNDLHFKEYFCELGYLKQELLVKKYFDSIFKGRNIKEFIDKLSPKIIIDLYKDNKEILKPLNLSDWVKLLSKSTYNLNYKEYSSVFKEILDSFSEIDTESLFDSKFYMNEWFKTNLNILKYVEMKYRNNIKISNKLVSIDKNTSIFSNKYICNLNTLKYLLKNNIITKKDVCYKKHLTNFILFLKTSNIIHDIDDVSIKEVERLFYRIVMGASLTILYEVSHINEITIMNRLGSIEFGVKEFDVLQLENFNTKLHKQLYNNISYSNYDLRSYKKLTLKLMLLVGFNNAKRILEIDNALPTLEHLVGSVDVKNIKLDNMGNPILNKKIINMLFSDKNLIECMLENKDSDLYKYFPRILNEWELIKMNKKESSLKMIIEYLKGDDVSVTPKYYRLEGLFKYIGCGNSIVSETFLLHDEMLKRTKSTIPRVKGIYGNYSYEVLKLDDMGGLTVGNKTDCCFTVNGNGYSCLKHALLNKNGRVLVIKKDDKIVAHSWLWRNGDLLCLDNIEISKSINAVNFFDVYLMFIEEIMKKSFEHEGVSSIKNVTIGYTNFDKKIFGIEKYPCLISKTCDLEIKDLGYKLGNNRKFVDELPQPNVENYIYTDSKNVQYLIRGNGQFNLSDVNFSYQDEREDVLVYDNSSSMDEETINNINKIINGLNYIKLEKDNNIDKFKKNNVKFFDKVYCNKDWYIIVNNGVVETFINSNDSRAYYEFEQYKEKVNVKKLQKVI